MTTAALQCKNCGANLVPDPQNPYNYYCPCCRSKYAPEQNDTYVTNEYKYDNNVSVGAGGVINQTIFEQSTLRQDLASANAKLRIGDYNSAFSAFNKLADKHSDCGEAWWGLVRAITRDFSLNPANKGEYLRVCKYMEYAIIQANEEKHEYQQRYDSYRTYWENHAEQLTKHREEKCSKISARLEAEKGNIQSKIDNIQSEIDNIKNQVAIKEKKIQKHEKLRRVIPFACSLILALIIFSFEHSFFSGSLFEIIGSLIIVAIFLGIFIYLPLKIVFFIVCKSVKLTAEAQINKLNRQVNVLSAQISQNQDDLQKAINVSEEEINAVISETAWINF